MLQVMMMLQLQHAAGQLTKFRIETFCKFNVLISAREIGLRRRHLQNEVFHEIYEAQSTFKLNWQAKSALHPPPPIPLTQLN